MDSILLTEMWPFYGTGWYPDYILLLSVLWVFVLYFTLLCVRAPRSFRHRLHLCSVLSTVLCLVLIYHSSWRVVFPCITYGSIRLWKLVWQRKKSSWKEQVDLRTKKLKWRCHICHWWLPAKEEITNWRNQVTSRNIRSEETSPIIKTHIAPITEIQ